MPWMLRNIFRNILGLPATRKYPFEPVHYHHGVRGRLQIDLARCVFCGMCELICPAKAITKYGSKKDPDVTIHYNPFACIYCARCAEMCPSCAIYVHEQHTLPADRKITYGREDIPFSEDELP
ncbi:MAG: 4Fe-4S binding protein [Candidatus Desulforudis sp.]|nr:4Fe-4S binding protein [Desulforudis sp.]